jgi:hypothetical protein
MTNSKLHNKINLRAMMIEAETIRQLRDNNGRRVANVGILVSLILKSV